MSGGKKTRCCAGPLSADQDFQFHHIYQVVEKRYERREDKAKFDEIAEFIPINEHFESNFNAVLSSEIVFQQPVICHTNKLHAITK